MEQINFYVSIFVIKHFNKYTIMRRESIHTEVLKKKQKRNKKNKKKKPEEKWKKSKVRWSRLHTSVMAIII